MATTKNLDITNWGETWKTINWEKDPEDEIKQKITDFYHAGVDFNMMGNGSRPLCLAAEYSTPGVVALLIDGGSDISLPDSDGSTPIQLAYKNKKRENLKYLVEHASRNILNQETEDGKTLLYHALNDNDREIIKELVAAKVNVNVNYYLADGYPALISAASHGHADVVDALIEAGANVNVKKDYYGPTALHRAAYYGYKEIVKSLIKAGASVNIRNDANGCTALHEAARKGHSDIVKALIKAGADVNVKDDCETTALHIAASHNYVDVVKSLIKAGANVNMKNYNNGYTALHLAVRSGSAKVVKALIEGGADVNIKNNYDKMAINYTDENDIIGLLIKNAALLRKEYLLKSCLQNSLHQMSEKVPVNNVFEGMLKKGKNIFADIFKKSKIR